MRNLLLVILISASSVWASDSYSQNTQLKLSATEGTIESIFNQISKQSRLEFLQHQYIECQGKSVFVDKARDFR